MGGRGKGLSGGLRDHAGSTAVLTHNAALAGRPWSVQGWEDGGQGAAWATDARGRARTFASETAAREYVQRMAGGPVVVTVAGRQDVLGLASAAAVGSLASTGQGGGFGVGVDSLERCRDLGGSMQRNPWMPDRSFKEVEKALRDDFGRKLTPLEREAAWEAHRKAR